MLEAMGRQSEVKPTLEKILSYNSLEVVAFDENDLLMGANNMITNNTDFNDGVNAAIMMRIGISEAYSNDQKHLSKLDFLRLTFK